MRIKGPKRRVLTPDGVRERLDALGITQAQAATEWSVSPDTVSRWMTGKQPVPGWVSYALDGIEYARMKKRGDEKGYQWPPAGYE